MKTVERKIKNGKLVRISVKFNGDRISDLKITGDFFMHPEESIIEFEQIFMGKKVEGLRSKIMKELVKRKIKIVCIGFDYNDVCSMVEEAWRCGE